MTSRKNKSKINRTFLLLLLGIITCVIAYIYWNTNRLIDYNDVIFSTRYPANLKILTMYPLQLSARKQDTTLIQVFTSIGALNEETINNDSVNNGVINGMRFYVSPNPNGGSDVLLVKGLSYGEIYWYGSPIKSLDDRSPLTTFVKNFRFNNQEKNENVFGTALKSIQNQIDPNKTGYNCTIDTSNPFTFTDQYFSTICIRSLNQNTDQFNIVAAVNRNNSWVVLLKQKDGDLGVCSEMFANKNLSAKVESEVSKLYCR